MVIADFHEMLSTGFMWLFIVVGFYSWAAKKYVANNPEVKDAAKKAASKKLISLIGKWLQ
jgi:hypothetical protein